jgi:hypothetical protein
MRYERFIAIFDIRKISGVVDFIRISYNIFINDEIYYIMKRKHEGGAEIDGNSVSFFA